MDIAVLSELLRQAQISPNTQKAYTHDWKLFAAWCQQAERESLPATAETILLFLTAELARGIKVASAVRRSTSIRYKHIVHGYVSPLTPEIWSLFSRARRLRRERPRQKRPITVTELREITAILAREPGPYAVRDHAILVLGFASALRRATIAGMQLDDIEIVPEGLRIRIPREKQDQEGRGRSIGIPYGKHAETCAVRSLERWLVLRGSQPGPLFIRLDRQKVCPLAPGAIGRTVKRAVERIALDPRQYGGHSLRAGFITAAAEAGAGELLIASHTGHRSMEILRKYFRPAHLFRANPCALLDL